LAVTGRGVLRSTCGNRLGCTKSLFRSSRPPRRFRGRRIGCPDFSPAVMGRQGGAGRLPMPPRMQRDERKRPASRASESPARHHWGFAGPLCCLLGFGHWCGIAGGGGMVGLSRRLCPIAPAEITKNAREMPIVRRMGIRQLSPSCYTSRREGERLRCHSNGIGSA